MPYLTKQIAPIVEDAFKDAIGKNASLTDLETTDYVAMGKAISQYNLYEGFYGSMVNRLIKTVYFVRMYKGKNRTILRDEHEFGAFIQKVYYEMPVSVDNPTYAIPDTQGDYHQASPYDVEGTIGVSAEVFGGNGTWSIEVIRPLEQIDTAFTSNTEMMRFIDGLYSQIENRMKMDEDNLVATAIATSMANELNGGHSRNLLNEYNTLTGQTLTVAQALVNAGALKFFGKEISETISHMSNMSVAFNKKGYTTFTDKEHLVVEMLSHFTSAYKTYLESDTFNADMISLPNFNAVDFWQGSGSAFSFADCSKINISHDDINGGEATEQGGIICFLHDIENVSAYFGKRRTWEKVNERSDVVIHGEKAKKGFGVDSHANAVVFYLAEEAEDAEDGEE